MYKPSTSADRGAIHVTLESTREKKEYFIGNDDSTYPLAKDIRHLWNDMTTPRPIRISIDGGEGMYSEPALINVYAALEPIVQQKRAVYESVSVMKTSANPPQPMPAKLEAHPEENITVRTKPPRLTQRQVPQPVFAKTNETQLKKLQELCGYTLTMLLKDGIISSEQRNGIRRLAPMRLALEVMQLRTFKEPVTDQQFADIQKHGATWHSNAYHQEECAPRIGPHMKATAARREKAAAGIIEV